MNHRESVANEGLMSPLPQSQADILDGNPFRVLVTGFGPFPPNHRTENPSWLAVRGLNNTILDLGPCSTAIAVDRLGTDPQVKSSSIHITSLQIPVIYQDVLDIVPRIHLRPPVLPDCEGSIPAPEKGYDFILHVGVAGRGPLRLEKVGHKLGYSMKDASGNLAPAVARPRKQDFSASGRGAENVLEAEKKPPVDGVGSVTENVERPIRGYGKGYEIFPDDMQTEIDVEKLIHDLKRSGIEDIYASMDAGHYLCDFIFFGSLAESKRRALPYEKSRQVLFLHCPPVNQPHSTEEVTEAIRRIVIWVCSELRSAAASDRELSGNRAQ